MSSELKPFHYHLYPVAQEPLISQTEQNYPLISYQSQIHHKELDVEKLESIILKDEPDFEFLKDVIRGYNRDVQKH